MDPFYDDFDLQLQNAILVYDDDDYLTSLGDDMILPPAERGSAFAAYQQGRAATTSLDGHMMTSRGGSGGANNVHQRMFAYLRRMGGAAAVVDDARSEPADRDHVAAQAPRHSSRFRHIMRERLRRERISQGFADLHALLPPGASKGGKNDIVSAAARYILELERRKRWLHARNEELLEQAAARTGTTTGMLVKVRAESEHSSVAVDVFEMVLRRLKAMEELRVIGIRSCFGDNGMWMNVGVEGQVERISGRDVDKAITNALTELVENAFGAMQLPRSSSRPAFSCHVERDVPMC